MLTNTYTNRCYSVFVRGDVSGKKKNLSDYLKTAISQKPFVLTILLSAHKKILYGLFKAF